MTTVLPAKSQFENAPAGSHLALCYGVIDLGTQVFRSREHGDETVGGIQFQFELPHEHMKDGRPFMINSRPFKLKSGKRAGYRLFLEAWRGVPFTEADFGKFDAVKVLGKPAMLSIEHTTTENGTYANIKTIMQPPKGTAIPPFTNKQVHFTFDHFSQEMYDSLTDWLKTKIALSPEYQKIKGGTPETVSTSAKAAADLDDEIPF